MRPSQAKKSDEQPIQCRITGARAESFPTGMTNIDGRRKDAAEKCRHDRANSIGHKRRKSAVAVARSFGAFDVLQRTDDVKNSHRQNDRQIIQKAWM